MEQTVIDGIPVFWKPGPAPLTATLTFGCGTRDETFRTIGVTHLIEHLAMSTLPRLHHDHNASVDIEVTTFFATGKPEQVVAFLENVCRALADLPLDRIEKEAGVLAAEGGHVNHPTAGTLLARRYGPVGPGLAPYKGPGYDRIPAEVVEAHAARYFTSGNAVLTLTGPPPDGLRLPLPAGPRAEHPPTTALPVDGPRWSAEEVPCPGLSLVGPADSAPWSIGMEVLRERLTAIARREKGLSYEVGGDRADPDPTTADRVLLVDSREGQEAEVAVILWDAARQLAVFGPDAEEIAHEVAGFAEYLDDPRSVEGELAMRASAELFDRPHRDGREWLDVLAAVTPEQVAAAFSAGMRSALLVVPEGVEVELTDLDGKRVPVGGCARSHSVPGGQVFRPGLRDRVLNKAARQTRLVLAADGVALCDQDDDVHLVRWSDVVGVEADGGSRVVFGRNGCIVPVTPELFRGVESAVAAVDAAVDPALRYRPTDLAG